MKYLAVIAIILLAGCTVGASGVTSVDNEARRLIAAKITWIEANKLHCKKIDSIKASQLPSYYVPPGWSDLKGSPPSHFERWIATGCGKQTHYLIVISPDLVGGYGWTMYYPFPKWGEPK